MSDHERFTQDRSEEMSDVSESLISLTKNERMSESFIFLSESLIFGPKTSDSLGNQMSEFPALNVWNPATQQKM